jgi:hypothetical protein
LLEAVMAINKLPDINFIRECLDYDPDTGVFTWRERPRSHFVSNRGWGTWNARYARKIAGWRHVVKRGEVYWMLTLNDKAVLAHRIAWLMTYDEDPAPSEIDHIDGSPLNNRIDNLRLATRQQQTFNRRARTHSATGARGITVGPNGRSYHARITIDGIVHQLGTFHTISEASDAYQSAARKMHGDFHREEG